MRLIWHHYVMVYSHSMSRGRRNRDRKKMGCMILGRTFHITQGLGPHTFLLCWSQSLSQFRSRSKPVWISDKGLFTRSDPITVTVSVTVKFYNCANGDGPSDGHNRFHTHSAQQTACHQGQSDKRWQWRGRNMYIHYDRYNSRRKCECWLYLICLAYHTHFRCVWWLSNA